MLGYVIGDSDMATGFRLVGVEGVEVASIEDALQALNKALGRSDLALIIISEEFSTQPKLHEIIDQVRAERRNPLIVEIGGAEENQAKQKCLISSAKP